MKHLSTENSPACRKQGFGASGSPLTSSAAWAGVSLWMRNEPPFAGGGTGTAAAMVWTGARLGLLMRTTGLATGTGAVGGGGAMAAAGGVAIEGTKGARLIARGGGAIEGAVR